MQRMLLLTGLLVLGSIWLGPLPGLATGSFAAHMAMHMGVVAVAAPLIALGMVGTRWDFAARGPACISPVPASVLELAIVWAWHAPKLHHWARHESVGLIMEQGMFLAAGILVWLSSFTAPLGARGSRTGAGVIGLLLASMHMTLLGALLALAPRALYSHEASAGLTPLEDQHLGGAIMLLVGGLSYLAGGLWLTARLLKGKAPGFQPRRIGLRDGSYRRRRE